MALITGFLPPSRETWELIVYCFQWFPVITVVQWFTDFWPQGKTSIESRVNIPGKIGWATMEMWGFVTLWYVIYSVPQELGRETPLPREHWVMAGMFTVHYIYRSFISPFLNPSMSPIHPFVWIAACCFQVINGLSIGGWLAGYGPTTENDWAGRDVWIAPGIMLWAFGLLGNIWHEDELREIRRAATRTQKRRDEAQQESKGRPKRVDKVYMIPQNGLFGAILYPHYLCEFVEWGGFWMVGGLGCVPARTFLINLLVVMTLRALAGRRWYVARFGREKIGAKKAIFPGLL